MAGPQSADHDGANQDAGEQAGVDSQESRADEIREGARARQARRDQQAAGDKEDVHCMLAEGESGQRGERFSGKVAADDDIGVREDDR